jgi:MoaD family protein
MSRRVVVRVNFYGVLREITGKKSDAIMVKSISLEDLLKTLSARFGASFRTVFAERNGLDSQVNIFVNNRVVPSKKIPEIKLQDGDQIDLFVPVSGG